MNSIVITAPAKVNLFLKILSKRKDSYHNILTLFERISLSDKIKISKIPKGIIVKSDVFITRDPEDNLVYKAAEVILKHAKVNSGVRIEIKKRILNHLFDGFLIVHHPPQKSNQSTVVSPDEVFKGSNITALDFKHQCLVRPILEIRCPRIFTGHTSMLQDMLKNANMPRPVSCTSEKIHPRVTRCRNSIDLNDVSLRHHL